MPSPTTYYCSKCDFKGSDTPTWGEHSYLLDEGKLSVHRALAICYDCNEVISAEVLEPHIELDRQGHHKKLREIFLWSRIEEAKCLKCGGTNFEVLKKTTRGLDEPRIFDTGNVHRNCGGKILAQVSELHLFYGDRLPKRFYDNGGNTISNEEVEKTV